MLDHDVAERSAGPSDTERPLVRLLLVDDHRVVRMGLRALFETVPHFVVVAEAGTRADAVTLARVHQPDIVVLDVRLPDGSGVDACRAIRADSPDIQVLMLTSYTDEDAIVASIMAGANGFVLKQIEPERLIEAVELVAEGRSLLDPFAAAAVLAWIRRLGAPEADDPLSVLTEQERDLLLLIAEGKTNREIAAARFLSEHTVKGYVSAIFQKLHLTRRAQAAALIARRGERTP